MLKLLVVDDEMVILQGIVKILREGKTPFTHIDSALDADEALSAVEHFSPDLIITDINMPGKNGLQLIEEVKEKELCNRFIILTGYDEFSYAKQAIRFQVIDYLLKPIDKREIVSLLRKVAKDILEEKNHMDFPCSDQSQYSSHVERIVNYIYRNYQQDLSLEHFSEITDLHPNYISYLFKKETGKSLVSFLRDYRIEKAKELLIKYPDLTVHIIGNQVGYENTQHFLKVFKQNVGCTPSSYRAKSRGEMGYDSRL